MRVRAPKCVRLYAPAMRASEWARQDKISINKLYFERNCLIFGKRNETNSHIQHHIPVDTFLFYLPRFVLGVCFFVVRRSPSSSASYFSLICHPFVRGSFSCFSGFSRFYIIFMSFHGRSERANWANKSETHSLSVNGWRVNEKERQSRIDWKRCCFFFW